MYVGLGKIRQCKQSWTIFVQELITITTTAMNKICTIEKETENKMKKKLYSFHSTKKC